MGSTTCAGRERGLSTGVPPEKEQSMQFAALGETGPSVSRACLGTMTFGSQVSEAEARRMTDHALDRGVNFIDTANVYNDGVSEEIVGRILKGRRSEVVLATKVRGRMGTGEDSYGGLSPDAIRRAAEESLRRLQTDCIDLYYLHQPDRQVPIESTLEAMHALRCEGKIRCVATSNYAAWEIAQMFEISHRRRFEVPRVAQPMYNALARGIEQEYLGFTRAYGVSNVCYNPLAGGLLSGKQSFAKGPLAGTRFDGNARYLDRFWHEEYFGAVEKLRAVADGMGISLAEFALRWVFHRPGVDSVILGASCFSHLEQNLDAAVAGPLPDDALEPCDAAWQALRGPTPNYNR